ncbi:hypothetical protein LMG28614_03196 [Paraburkholderia ultramafica]|uniref:Glycoside hydrolase family 19 catalytic domain-containing protein n=1 Tax=Paraburkholderia ultramafica TaxID=1544867 RepID=A0A6S7B9X8_9BURK|nr:glycoside hydrolase family 19 protein [Paraburkholderia ultramafica]CAB3790922.1 hypothetical protein LMG28614_03196 [Paraburkholderia ultramafica]
MTTHPDNHPAAPQPASSQVWRYPFPAKDGKEITDPATLYRALGRMEDGYFPLGVNGFPHGGVHFGAGSTRELNQSAGVRVIANGAIVAFKLDDAYPHIQFTQDHRWGMYSTGFVLVRHQMTMPPAPGSTAAQPADETLTFYSLYMHMADWSTYLADGNLVRPGWWPGVDAYRIGNKDRHTGSTSDSGEAGAFVCQGPGGKRLGFLPENSEVIIGEKRGAWGHIKSISSGTAPLTPEGDWGWINYHDQRAMKEPQDVGKVVIPPQPIQVTAGTLLGQLGEYHDYERSTPLPPVPARQLLHLEVFAGAELKPFLEKSRARAAQLPADERTILLIQPGAKLVPKQIDANLTLGDRTKLHDLVVTADSPKNGRWMKVQPRTQSSDKVFIHNYFDPVWIERDDQKRLTSPNGLTAWSAFPLQLSSATDPANDTTFAMPRAQLDSVDARYDLAIDDKGVSWWRIEFGTADNKNSMGWVCSTGHPKTSWESPWAWPGFDIVDATGIILADAFKRNLVVCGNVDWKEQKEFEPSMAAVNGSALLQRLEQTVARLPLGYSEKREKGQSGEEVVTARMLSRAMYVPRLASELAHVILRYESEWGGGMARWDAITPLMRNARENWECELTRIRKLQWWDEVKGKVEGFPANPVVNHIHPVALVGNFNAVSSLVCPHCGSDLTITSSLLKTIFPSVIGSTADQFAPVLTKVFSRHEINTCNRVAHFFGQCEVECGGFTAFKEDLFYRDGDYLWNTYHSSLTAGLKRMHPDWTQHQIQIYAKNDLVRNDNGLGEVLFGDNQYPGQDYRGRGLLHMTWLATYKQYKQASGIDVAADPKKVQSDPYVAADSSAWFWSVNGINSFADANNVHNVTHKINPALKDFARRKAAAKRAFELLNKGVQPCKSNWDSMLTAGSGW